METLELDGLLDEHGNPVNPEDAEAVSNALMRKAGVVFGRASDIYTDEQLSRITQRRGEFNLSDVDGETKFTDTQELIDRAKDDLEAGRVVGLDEDQHRILLLILKGWTYRDIAELLGKSKSFVGDQVSLVRARIQNKGSVLWIWLTIAEVFSMGVSSVRDTLEEK